MGDEQPPQVDNTALLSSINAVSLRLPEFAIDEPLTWFRRAETKFRIKGISRAATKSDYVLEALPQSVFTRISPWLDQQPDPVPYDDLKVQLLTEYSPTPSERARRLVAMTNQPIGDRKPSQIWDEICSLCRLPEIDPTTQRARELDIKKELWLQTLPAAIRTLLHDTDANKIDDLTKKADSILESQRHSRPSLPISSVDSGPEDSADEIIASAGPQRQSSKRYSRDKDRPRQPPRSHFNENGICSYHQRFGQRAKNCLDGCKWTQSKNVTSGRG